MSEVTLAVDHNGVALITLDAPDRRNSMNLAMVEEIVAIVDKCVADDGVGALVVTGAGKGFCAGATLDHLAGSTSASESRAVGSVYDGFLVFANCPKPTIAAVNGAAVGAGMNLALACDVRIASSNAKFITRFLDLGLHPGGGHTWMLQRIVGPQVARAMVLFGQEYSGADAARFGLAYDCTAPDELIPRALELGARAASAPRELSQRTKATMQRMLDVDTSPDAVAIELEVQAWSLQQPEFKERIAKFQTK
ncbi:MAG TPA: enoyl-CoA hydratase [Acidimicrobiales bacterium]|nr:enoyl-CoA hydratase [Acidimicrobiales bacterium]